MSIESNKIAVEVIVKGYLKKIPLSAPKELDLVAAAKAFGGISQNVDVQESLANLTEDCHVEILALGNTMVGISIPDDCDKVEV